MREGSRGAPRRGSGAIARPHGARQHGRYFVFEDANLAVRAEAGLLGEPGVIVLYIKNVSAPATISWRCAPRCATWAAPFGAAAVG